MSDEKAYLKPIGVRLREIRTKLGFSNRDQFSEAYGVPKRTFEKYEQGLVELPTKLLLWLQASYSVNLTWLITGVGNTFVTDSETAEFSSIVPSVYKSVKSMIEEINGASGILLPDTATEEETICWYNRLLVMARGNADEGKLRSLLPALHYDLSEAVRSAAAEPGTGKRAAS